MLILKGYFYCPKSLIVAFFLFTSNFSGIHSVGISLQLKYVFYVSSLCQSVPKSGWLCVNQDSVSTHYWNEVLNEVTVLSWWIFHNMVLLHQISEDNKTYLFKGIALPSPLHLWNKIILLKHVPLSFLISTMFSSCSTKKVGNEISRLLILVHFLKSWLYAHIL